MWKTIKSLGVVATSIKGWLIVLGSAPFIATAVSGFFHNVPWPHIIALSALALAAGVVAVMSGVTVWEKLGGQKQRIYLERKKALGVFIDEGRELEARCVSIDRPASIDELNDWSERLDQYLETNLEPSYVSRLNDSSGIRRHPFVPAGVPSEQINRKWQITFRLARLHEFLQELSHNGTR